MLRIFLVTLLLAIGISLIWISYSYIDRDVAWWIFNHHVSKYHVLKWFTYLSTAFAGLVIVIYIYVALRFCFKKHSYFDRTLLAMANSIVIASYIKNALKVVFGRSWPLTWVKNNASLIKNGSHGFRFFHGSTPYSAFPSGHTAVIVAAMTVLWFAYPRGRVLYVLLALAVITGLIGMNYHFVSDVIAGAIIGLLIGYFTAKISGLKKQEKNLEGFANGNESY